MRALLALPRKLSTRHLHNEQVGKLHEATFRNSVCRHALVVASTGSGRVVFPSAGSRGTSRCVSGGSNCSGYCSGLCFCTERKSSIDKLFKSTLIMKEHSLAETGPTKLETNSRLSHCRLANVLTLFINASFAISSTD